MSLFNDGPSRLQFGLVANERSGGRGEQKNWTIVCETRDYELCLRKNYVVAL